MNRLSLMVFTGFTAAFAATASVPGPVSPVDRVNPAAQNTNCVVGLSDGGTKPLAVASLIEIVDHLEALDGGPDFDLCGQTVQLETCEQAANASAPAAGAQLAPRRFYWEGVEGGGGISLLDRELARSFLDRERRWARKDDRANEPFRLQPTANVLGTDLRSAITLINAAGWQNVVLAPPRSVSQADRLQIKRIVDEHVHELSGCFESEHVVVKFVIGMKGNLFDPLIRVGVPRPDRCNFSRVMRRWSFPPPRCGGVIVVSRQLDFPSDGGAPSSSDPPPHAPRDGGP